MPRIIQRSSNYVRKGYEVLKNWTDSQNSLFSYTMPEASTVTFMHYHLAIMALLMLGVGKVGFRRFA